MIAAAVVVLAFSGMIAYRRALPGGAYDGTMGGSIWRGAVLGLFLGLTVGLATLLLVLVIRAFR